MFITYVDTHIYIYIHILVHTYTFGTKPMLNVHGNPNSVQPKLSIQLNLSFPLNWQQVWLEALQI